MVVDPEIRQRLLELIYGVLPDDEAAELHARIAAEPELARAYAQAQAAAGVLAEAAKLVEPDFKLNRPESAPTPDVVAAAVPPERATSRPKPSARPAEPSRKPRIRGMTWLVSLAAGILLAISLGGYFYHRGLLADIAADHLRLRVIGPSRLQASVASHYRIETTSVTGSPVSSQIQFVLYSPTGHQLISHKERTDDNGFLNVTIPADLPIPGQVRLEIEAAGDDKLERVNTVLGVDPPRLATYLTPDKLEFQPGETVRYRSVTLERFTLLAEQQAAVRYEIVDPSGSALSGSTVSTTARDGAGSGRKTLPADASAGAYTLVAGSPQGQFANARCTFNVKRGNAPAEKAKSEKADLADKPRDKVEVHFFPESGPLVAGLENRVFFRASDPQGEPVQVRGTVIDSDGNAVARAESIDAGMGAFSLEPQLGRRYCLVIDTPKNVKKEQLLPPVSDSEVLLTTGLGVFKARQPLQFNVRSQTAGIPLVVSAWCRGAEVGQQALVTRAEANPVEIDVDEKVDGVVRLIVYDYRNSPPRPVAERLVFRRPARRLQIDAKPLGQVKPGEPAKLALTVTDENGTPVPASMGVSIVELPVLKQLAAGSSSMTAHFLLADQLTQAPKDLDGYLADDPKAAVALDLLLGTQERPFMAKQRAMQTVDAKTSPANVAAALAASISPPTVFDNLSQLQKQYKDSLASYRANRTRPQNSLTVASLLGGLGLVLFVAMLAIMNVPTGLRLWAPAISAAIVCVVMGAVLMNPERRHSMSGSMVAFAPFNTAPPPAPGAPKSEFARSTGPPADTSSAAESDEIGRFAEEKAEERLERKDAVMTKGAAEGSTTNAPKIAAKSPPTDAPKGGVASQSSPSKAAPPASEPPPPAAAPAQPMPATLPAVQSPPADAAQSRARSKAAPEAAKKPASAPKRAAKAASPPADSVSMPKQAPPGYGGKAAAPSAGQAMRREPFGLQLNQQAAQSSPAAQQLAEPEMHDRLEVQSSKESLHLQMQAAPSPASGVLFWNPLLVADKGGRAEIQFQLPAGTKQYAILVDAYGDGRLGSVQVELPVPSP